MSWQVIYTMGADLSCAAQSGTSALRRLAEIMNSEKIPADRVKSIHIGTDANKDGTHVSEASAIFWKG